VTDRSPGSGSTPDRSELGVAASRAVAIGRIFREECGRSVATLIRVFGQIDVGEDAVEDAFALALRLAAGRYAPQPGGSITISARRCVVAAAPFIRWVRRPYASASSLILAVADWLAFGRMLLAGGTTVDGRWLLSADAVQLMINNHTTPEQRRIGELFLEGQGWGFEGSVDIEIIDQWNVLGRYGWVGGTGTSAHITPSTGRISILLAQVATEGPTPSEWMRTFWQYAASNC
jgi:CubicO group peptidase (beta-lactamase class C family)